MRRILKKSSRVKQQRVNETIPSNTCKRIWWLASRSRLILLWMLSVICLFQGSVEHIDRSSSDAWIHPQCQWSRPNSSSREISEKANEASLSFLLRNWSMRWKRNWLKWFIVEMVLVSRSIVYGMVPTRWVMKTILKSFLWMSFVYSGSKTADQEFEIIRGEDCQRRARLSDIVDDLRCGRRYKTCFKNRPTSTTIALTQSTLRVFLGIDVEFRWDHQRSTREESVDVHHRSSKHQTFTIRSHSIDENQRQFEYEVRPTVRLYFQSFLLLISSKKDAEIRQRELFDYCKSYFLDYFTNNILSTLKDGFKGFMLTEVIERLSRKLVISMCRLIYSLRQYF